MDVLQYYVDYLTPHVFSWSICNNKTQPSVRYLTLNCSSFHDKYCFQCKNLTHTLGICYLLLPLVMVFS